MRPSPGFVDLQVNGHAGVDFNGDHLDVREVELACDKMRKGGVAGILATVITDDISLMCHRIKNIVQVCNTEQSIKDMIWGIHIEGPFLNPNPGFIGAHPKNAVRPADLTLMSLLLRAGWDLVRIVTLAPEQDPDCKVTRELVSRRIIVSAGHTDASIDQLRIGIEAGLSMFTHLGNGCPLQMHRHDNIIQRVLSLTDQLWIGFIADCVHIPAPALRNYLRLAGENAFVVTDAIQAAGLGPGSYKLAGQTVNVDEDLSTWSSDRSHLIGSASTMSNAVANLHDKLGLNEDEIHRMTSTNPRRILLLPDDC